MCYDGFTQESIDKIEFIKKMFQHVEYFGEGNLEFNFTLNLLKGKLYINHKSIKEIHYINIQWFGENSEQSFGIRTCPDGTLDEPYHHC